MMMERILLSVLCLSGWVIFSTCLLHQYHFVSESMNWTEAQTYCREKYTDLATIENTEEMDQLINTVRGPRLTFWIGLYSKIEWRWSDSYKGPGAEYRNWRVGQPVHKHPEHNYFCVVIGGSWEVLDCSSNVTFICNNGTRQKPEFVHVNQRMSWSSAQRYCRENFTDLATVTNNTQNQEIQKLVPKGGLAWIGLFRDPQVYWSDGSSSSYRHWYNESKRICQLGLICGATDLQKNGQWRLLPCKTEIRFFCHSVSPPPAVKSQIFKVKIRRDSSVDLNDPAVQADILKKFEDRLKEKGVSGVTLKWRKQSDGKVFHKEEKTSQKKKRNKTEL